MSRLRELRLHGFKTFADPTRFVFESGVNAVIGPNGSGKSNMADAVRWVLGEQSNRSLRTRRADDVIFAGSQQRKPQGLAEAILTLDNEDGWLPVDFAEVTIGRRAYRSGESEYLVNGARARLRDVVELLGAGQLGANELVVVGQGTVDAALSLRPEERRQLFEEAAGVKNLQVRKNEALSRLNRARDNVTRVRDLIGELKPQVRRLALQAQHQQEHDTLGRRAHGLVRESHRRRELQERSALGEARRRAAASEAELEELRSGERAARAAIAEAEERYWQAETAARAAATDRDRTREALIRAESRLDALGGRLTDLERSIAASQDEVRQVEAALQQAPAQAGDELRPLLEASAQAEAAWRAAGDALGEADAETLAAEEALASARAAASESIARAARTGELRASLEARAAAIAAEREALGVERGAAVGNLPEETAAVGSAEEEVAVRRADLQRLMAEVEAAQVRADAARRHAAELAERVGGMRGELEALHERAERGGRLGSMLTAAGWGALLDGLDAPLESWPAIEAAIGGEVEQALLWRDGELAGRLAQARGSARLLASDAPDADADERARALRAVGAARTLAEWLGPDRAPRLFWYVAIAPNVEALITGWRDLPIGWLAVTAHGDVADGRGLLAVRGRGEGPSGEAARRHARRRELADALGHEEGELEAATTDAARAHAAVSASLRELDDARAQLAEGERVLAAARTALDGAAARRDRLAARLGELQQAQAEVERRLAELPSEGDADAPAVPSGKLDEIAQRASRARAQRDTAAATQDTARNAWLTARASADEAEAQLTGDRRRRSVLEARQAQLISELPALQSRLADGWGERDELRGEVEAARAADTAAGEARDAAEAERERLRAALRELEHQDGGGAGRLATLEAAMQTAVVEVSRREEALAALERERQLAVESLPELEQDREERAETADAAEALAAELRELDDGALEQELRRVRRTLAQIGSVNPFAVEEHRELAARLDELTGQDDDLSAAIGNTEELIGRLDAEITEQFHAAFVAIGERFDEFCRLLFAGGSASLQLGDEEDGDAPGGIEIVVRPPGKRLQRLAMLSGGERALTGVALLFAMLSVNPVPFCILDEVDAALDEANIGRFAQALRQLANEIDFVVITHNRATIEVADTIYGVTMSDDAVSRIVSLRLADLPDEVTAEVPA